MFLYCSPFRSVFWVGHGVARAIGCHFAPTVQGHHLPHTPLPAPTKWSVPAPAPAKSRFFTKNRSACQKALADTVRHKEVIRGHPTLQNTRVHCRFNYLQRFQEWNPRKCQGRTCTVLPYTECSPVLVFFIWNFCLEFQLMPEKCFVG